MDIFRIFQGYFSYSWEHSGFLEGRGYLDSGAFAWLVRDTLLRECFLREVKKPSTKVQHSNTDIDKLVKKIEASGVSIAPEYDQYKKLAIVFANELGENGRDYFHRVCLLDSKYNSKDCNKIFDDMLKRNYTDCTLGTLIYYMKHYNVI